MGAKTKKSDVFLSFRGEDTRDFTRALFNALDSAKVRTFIDEKLKIGDDISDVLQASIKQAKVSVIVLSENFANSSWCLKELELIVERMKKDGQVIVPVFYRIERSDVGQQRGAFRLSSERFDGRNKDKAGAEAALEIIADIEGLDSRQFESDSELIQAIVKDVKGKLRALKISKWIRRVGTAAVVVGAPLLLI